MQTIIFQSIRPETISFMPVPKMKPAKAPNADFMDVHTELPAKMISARKAPAIEPRRIQTGGMNMPSNRPIVAPQPAYLLPPLIFVIQLGTM